ARLDDGTTHRVALAHVVARNAWLADDGASVVVADWHRRDRADRDRCPPAHAAYRGSGLGGAAVLHARHDAGQWPVAGGHVLARHGDVLRLGPDEPAAARDADAAAVHLAA